jgi:hypothetical protein
MSQAFLVRCAHPYFEAFAAQKWALERVKPGAEAKISAVPKTRE